MYCYNIAPAFADGSSLKSIGVNAFYNCYEMTSISIPNSVEEIGSSAFQACNKLATANIPASLKAIPEGMLQYLHRYRVSEPVLSQVVCNLQK